jgi:hypothetical protein
MRKLFVAVSLTAVLAVPVATVMAPAAQATKPDPEHKVTLCHRTHSETNPYVVITVDVASVKFEGHDSHDGPVWYPGAKEDGVFWGDIIPSFTQEDGYPFDYEGKNLTEEGEAILEAGCETPEPSPTPTPTPTETPSPTPTETPSPTPPPTSTPPPTTTPPTHSTHTPPPSTTVCAGPDCHKTADTGIGRNGTIAAGAGLMLLTAGALALRKSRKLG